MIIRILLYLSAFIIIWQGAGIIIRSIDRISKRLKLSSFAASFFILGILTSIPEMAIGATAVGEHNPEIFVGTLLGGTIVIFLAIIPLLAILGKGVRINHDLDQRTTLFALGVMATPGFLVIDHKVTNAEGLFLIILYGVLFYMIQKKHGIFDKSQTEILELKAYSFMDIVKVVLGVVLVILSSRYIVDQTIMFSELFHIPALYLSLILLSFGTNIPELSLAVRAVLSGKKDIAFGDYLGSAAANTLLFGIFTLINDGEVLTTNNFMMTFVFTVVGLGLFYYFSRSRRDISRGEGIVLFSIYAVFILYEVAKGIV